MINIDKYIKKVIKKIRWRAYDEQDILTLVIYNDNSKYYRWEDRGHIEEWINNSDFINDYWLKFYWNIIRTDYKDYHYRIEIIKFNEKGKIIKEYKSDWS